MNKKSKIIAGLTACVCALSITAIGFSQWNSDIKLSGSVSAKGSWDISVEEASMKTSDGAILTYDSFDNEMFLNSYAPAEKMETKIAELESAGANIVSNEVVEAIKAYISYYDAEGVYHDKELIGYYPTIAEADAAKEEAYNKILENGGKVNSRGRTSAWYYTVSYTGVSSEAEINGSSVSYDAVEFNRPGAWAEYSVKVTNNGTSAANLNDYVVNVTNLDEAVFSVDTPDLSNDVLNPGESCTFTVVVKVIDDLDNFDVSAQDFNIELVYAPNAIEAAPSASHNH